MRKVTTQYQCGQCPAGVVNVVTKQTKMTISITVGNCNKCKQSYGMKSVGALKEVPAITQKYVEQAQSGDFIIN